ncbi:MAG: membrane dipeptidase, partial [Woeseiaceae bacterium]
MKDSIVVDALNCISLFRPPNWLDIESHRDLVFDYWERARQAGVTAMGITRGVDPDRASTTIDRMAYMSAAVNSQPDRFMLVRNSKDIREAHATGKLGIFYTNQGCCCFDENLQLVGAMKDMGMGYALIAYNNRYRTGDGAYEADNAGLTAWGRHIIKAQIHYGMPVDVTHTGIRCTAE